jgi:hypothetical protein
MKRSTRKNLSSMVINHIMKKYGKCQVTILKQEKFFFSCYFQTKEEIISLEALVRRDSTVNLKVFKREIKGLKRERNENLIIGVFI